MPLRPSLVAGAPAAAGSAQAPGVLALAALLWWLCRTHPGFLPPWAPWEFSWVEFLATAFALVWYLRGVALADAARRPALGCRILFIAGLAVIYGVLQTRFLYLAEHEFFLNRVQHLAMHHLGPFLIALSGAGPALRRGMPGWARRVADNPYVVQVIGWVQRPLPAAALFAGLIFLWLIPAVHFRAMLDARLFAVMNWSMVVDGILFWCLIFGPRSRLPAATRIILVMSVQLPQIALGAFIALTPKDLYGFYTLCGRVFADIGPRLDQEIGGFLILYGGGMMSAAAALILMRELLRSNEGAAVPGAELTPTE